MKRARLRAAWHAARAALRRVGGAVDYEAAAGVHAWRHGCSVVGIGDRNIARAIVDAALRPAPKGDGGYRVKGGQGSHWDGCYKTHADCADRLIEEQRAEIERLRASAPKGEACATCGGRRYLLDYEEAGGVPVARPAEPCPSCTRAEEAGERT